MARERLVAAVVALLAAAVPFWVAPAGASSCDPTDAALATPTRALQDDVDSGRDAPDVALGALRLPVTPVGDEIRMYYWGWLDPGPARPGADSDDWYSVKLTGSGATVNLTMAMNYTQTGVAGYAYTLRLYDPGGHLVGVSVGEHDPIVVKDDRAGIWHLQATSADQRSPCAALETPPLDAAPLLARNYGVYFGCHPVCVDVDWQHDG